MSYNAGLATTSKPGLMSDSDKRGLASVAKQAPLFDGLVAYLRSDVGVHVDGSNNVTAWDDQSGAGLISSYVADSSYNKPTYAASGGPNNAPYLAFNAAALTSTTTLLAAGSARTIFVVAQSDTFAGGALLTNKRGGGAVHALSLQRSSEQQYFFSDGAVAANTIAPNTQKAGNVLRADISAPFIVCYDTNGTGDLLGVRLNGKACATNGAPIVAETGTTDGVVLGNRENPAFSSGWGGKGCCWLVYNRRLSQAEIVDVHAFLSKLYGIAVSVEETMQLQTLNLWPGSPKVGTGNAQLKVYLPSSTLGTPGRRPAYVHCPGGGYGVVDESFGRDMCAWAASLGYVGIVLHYRLPDSSLSFPGSVCQDDALRTVRLLRAGAEKGAPTSAPWGIDSERIIFGGESAGGHLATVAATHWDTGNPGDSDLVEQCSSRPNFSVLLFPVVNMDDGTISYGSGVAAFIGSAGGTVATAYSSEKQVTGATPPAFMAWADDDGVVNPQNSIRYLEALIANGARASDFVEFATGNHGVGFPGSQQVLDLKKACWTWLQQNVSSESAGFRYGRFLDQRPAQRFSGRVVKSVAGGSNVTLSIAESSAAILELTGALTANISVIVPMNENGGELTIANLTSGAFTLTVKVVGQTGFSIAQGKRCRAYFNGADIVRITDDSPGSGGGGGAGVNDGPHAPTLPGGSSNLGSGFATAAYTKTPDGYVHLDGVFAGVGPGQVLFTLPAGFRPAAEAIMICAASNSGAYVAGRINVLTSGDVVVVGSANDFVSLCGLAFST